MSYTVSDDERFLIVADYVIRVLNGERIADLPVVRPTPRLAINLNAAREIGVEFPLYIHALADGGIPGVG